MKPIKRDYQELTAHALNCGMEPFKNRNGNIEEGIYTLIGKNAPVDLSACAADEKSILRIALKQLSEQADELYHAGIENDLNN